MRRVTITAAEAGQRIDNWLMAQLKGVPRSHVYKLLKSGQVRINSGRVKPTNRVQAGDEVRIPPVRTTRTEGGVPPKALIERVAAAIVYETDDWIAFDKPAGLAVHAGSGIEFGVIEALRAMHNGDAKLELAHRLDRETSGTLLIAKHRDARLLADAAFREHRTVKCYAAVLHGRVETPTTVDAALDIDNRYQGERTVIVSENGKPSVSHFAPIEATAWLTRADIRIETGRTHQIRVHAAHIGHPIVGDRRYGRAETDAVLQPGRMCLHAQHLSLLDEGGEVFVQIDAPQPDSFAALLRQ